MTIKPSPRPAGSVRRVLVSVGLGATLVLGGAGAAAAGTWSFTDPSGDVARTDADGDVVETLPARARGDVQEVAVSHMQSKLLVRINLRQSLGSKYWDVKQQVVTPRARYNLGIYRSDGCGAVTLFRYEGFQEVREVRCSGLTITYGARSVVVSFPTACLENPA